MKKILSILMTAVLLLTLLVSCSGTPVKKPGAKTTDPENTGEQNTLKLAYSKNDSLNPTLCETIINSQITGLVFDGLYKLDSSYKPVPLVAKSAVVGSSIVSITINEFRFSDGTGVSTSDIITSFNMAKSSTVYKSRLENFSAVHTGSENSLVFDLERADPYALSCLDFPIIKNGSDFDYPVGCGRYAYKRDGDNIYLVVNPFRSDFNPIFKTVNLEAVHDSDSFESSLVIGNTSFCYNELGSGDYTRINANNVDMGINNLVYLGFNMNDSFFSNPLVRRAVNLAIDRQSIVNSAFRSHARECRSPFNPDWYAIEDTNPDRDQNTEKAKELIEKSGIEPATREVTILFSSDNVFKSEAAQIIADSLEKIGFYPRLKPYETQAFLYDVRNVSFDMYIGEVKLNRNMDLTPLFTGDASYGIFETDAALVRYNDFLSGNCELIDFINTFYDDVPFAPICYRNAVVSYTKSMHGDFRCCDSDVFYDIETWSIK